MLLLVKNIPWKPYKTRYRGGNLLGNTIFLLRTAVCLWQMINTLISLTVHISPPPATEWWGLVPDCPTHWEKDWTFDRLDHSENHLHMSRPKHFWLSQLSGVYVKHKSGNHNLLMCKKKQRRKISGIHQTGFYTKTKYTNCICVCLNYHHPIFWRSNNMKKVKFDLLYCFYCTPSINSLGQNTFRLFPTTTVRKELNKHPITIKNSRFLLKMAPSKQLAYHASFYSSFCNHAPKIIIQ